MLELTCIQGSASDWVLQAINRDGTAPTGFLSGDTLAATVWRGQDQASLFAPTVSWSDYTVGKVAVSVTAAQTAALDQNGEYHLQVTATRSSTTVVIIDCLLRILAAPGSASQAVTPYCTLSDMLRYAPWLTMIQDGSSDQEGYYSQRLEARQWLDWLITRSWRGTSQAYFGDAGRTAQFWLGGWVRRTPLPSQWLINELAGGFLTSPTVTNAGSGYTSTPTITLSGGGGTGGAVAANVTGGTVVSLYIVTQGSGYTSAPSLVFSGGGGTGAAGTVTISAGALIVRPQTVRLCAMKAASIVGLGQIGRNNGIAAVGARFRDLASAEASSYVAEIDLNGDGIADLPIPLNAVNTLFT
jgi:hypothetical protein